MVESSSSTLSSSHPWQMSVVVLLVPLPLAAFLYALVSALFLASFGECCYTHYLVPQVLPRLSHLVATVAAVLVVFQQEQQQQHDPSWNQRSSGGGDIHVEPWMFLLAAFNWIVSIHWIRSTRIQVIEGGPAPPLPFPSFALLKDKVVVITGANSGIGLETARALAAMGATVVMACRSVERAQQARRECIESILLQQQQETNTKRNGSSVEPPKMDILQLDLSSLASVRQAAAELNRRYNKVDILINNAGVMMGHQVLTSDGYELVMQANHLGHYLFTRLLLDHYQLLGKSASSKPSSPPSPNDDDISRILILSSSTYVFADRIDLEDLFCQKGQRPYSLFGQYAQSKLSNLLFVNELARRYGGDQSNMFVAALHPGMVRTDVVRNMPWYLYYPNTLFASFIAVLQKTPEQGAWNTLYLATAPVSTSSATTNNGSNTTSPGWLPSGCYWVNRAVQEKRPCALDRAGAEQLWTDSAKYVGLTRQEQEPAPRPAK